MFNWLLKVALCRGFSRRTKVDWVHKYVGYFRTDPDAENVVLVVDNLNIYALTYAAVKTVCVRCLKKSCF